MKPIVIGIVARRIAHGGAQQYFGVTPDLTTLGKVIGGGLPVGAYGGRRDIMQNVAPAGSMYQVIPECPSVQLLRSRAS